MTDRNDEYRSGNQTRNTGRQARQQARGQGGQQYGRQQGYQQGYQQPQQQSQHNQPWQQSQQSGAQGGRQHHAAEEYTAQDYGRAQAYGQEGLEREYGQSFERGHDETSYGEHALGGSAYGRDYGDRFSTHGQSDWEQERSDQFQYGMPRQDQYRSQGSQSQGQQRQGSRSSYAQGGRGSRDYQRQRQGVGGGGYQGGSQDYSGYTGRQQGESYGSSSGYGSPESDRYGVGGYQGTSFVSPADTQQSHAGMGRQSYSGMGPKNYTRSDERLTEDLCERLTMDHDIDASDIEVKVAQGTATLEGTVSQRWMKHRAEDLADGCPGVRSVENRIKVQSESSYGASSTQRSSGSQTEPLAGRTGGSTGTAH